MKKTALFLAAAFVSVPAFACGPDFPAALLDDRAGTLANLPQGVFANEAASLVPAPPKPFKANEVADWIYTNGLATRDSVEREWLGSDYERAQTVRAQPDATHAYDAGEGLPETARRYLAGAAAFAHGDRVHARQRFASVLTLPEAERKGYEVWALYMEGRSSADDNPQLAMQAYAQVRERVAAGVPDPLGLAIDSYGEEARLHMGAHEVPSAVRLYAEQAAQGSLFGKASLQQVAERVLRDPALLRQSMNDPLTRKLLAVYLRTRGDGFIYLDADAVRDAKAPASPLPSTAFADALEQANIEDGDGVAQLAAFAYQNGRYDLAARFAAMSHEGLAAWVRAKLALRAGDVAKAAAEYAQAAKAFPAYVPALEGDSFPRDGESDYCRVQGEAGTLSLARGEYVDAMEHLSAAAPLYSADASFVAERVLTIEELRTFVDAHATQTTKAGSMQEGGGDYMARPFAATLARRLLRAERWDDAVAYFDDPALRTKAQAYADARRATAHGDAIEQADAWYRAAVLARSDGMELIGYDYDPDMAAWGGNFENVYGFGYGTGLLEQERAANSTPAALPFPVGPIDSEKTRTQATVAVPDKRFHYRYVAAEFAARAADLVPHRSQAYAALLCAATRYVLYDDLDRARDYWHRYVKNGPHVAWAENFGTQCEPPDFPGAARRLHAERIAAIKHALRRAAPYAAGVGIVLLVLGTFAWRRRRRPKPA